METVSNSIAFLIASPFICCGWIIIGGIAGALARRIMGSSTMPFISDMILGLAGAFVGGFVVSNIMGLNAQSSGLQQLLITLVVATFGASILIALGRLIRGRR